MRLVAFDVATRRGVVVVLLRVKVRSLASDEIGHNQEDQQYNCLESEPLEQTPRGSCLVSGSYITAFAGLASWTLGGACGWRAQGYHGRAEIGNRLEVCTKLVHD